MRQKTSCGRLIHRPKRFQKAYAVKRRRICRFFGIDPTKKELTKEEFLEVLQKLGVPEDAIEREKNMPPALAYRFHVYVPYNIVGAWGIREEEDYEA